MSLSRVVRSPVPLGFLIRSFRAPIVGIDALVRVSSATLNSLRLRDAGIEATTTGVSASRVRRRPANVLVEWVSAGGSSCSASSSAWLWLAIADVVEFVLAIS